MGRKKSWFAVAAMLLVIGGANRTAAQDFYRRGDATCSTSLGAADIVATVRALGGAASCGNDDCDRDGEVTAADVPCAARCLFGTCPAPEHAASVTSVAPESAPSVVPSSVVRVAVGNLGDPTAHKQVTIGGLDAEIVEETDGELLVALPSDLPAGPADVVVTIADVAGPPTRIEIAPAQPIGQPDTLDGMLDLIDELYGTLLSLDVEAAFPENAAIVRQEATAARAELAAQRAALASAGDLTEEQRLALDAAVESSGVCEMLRADIAEIDAMSAASADVGGPAAPTAPLAWKKGARTIKVAANVARTVAVNVGRGAATTLGIPIVIAIGTGIAINAAAIGVASDPLKPLIFKAIYTDASGNVRQYPTAGGLITLKGANFDALVTRLDIRGRGYWQTFGENTADDGITYQLPDHVGVCGKVTFDLVNANRYYSNPVTTRFQPELVSLPATHGKPLEPVTAQARGMNDCFFSTMQFVGVTTEFASLEFEGAHTVRGKVPVLLPGTYNVSLDTEGVRNLPAEDQLFAVTNPYTGLRIFCPPTIDLPSNMARCELLEVLGLNTIPTASKIVWTSSRPGRVSVIADTRFTSTAITARDVGTAKLKATLESSRGPRLVLATSEEMDVEVVDRIAPTVSITSTTTGSVQPGASIPLSVTVSDNHKLAALQLITTGDAVANGATQESLECTGKKTCTVEFNVTLKASDFMQQTVTVQAAAYDVSVRRGNSNVLTFNIAQDTTGPTVSIDSPPSGGNVNAGETVTVVATARDEGPADTGVRRFVYSASGASLTAPVMGQLPLPMAQKSPMLRFNFTVKNAAELTDIEDKTITISVEAFDDAMPPNASGPQTISVGILGVLDRCQGGINAVPPAGYIGQSFTITVVLTGEGADEITRVTSINPGGQFDLQPQGDGVYTVTLFYQGTGAFTLRFVAIDANGDERCSGSVGLESLGPRPEAAAAAVRDAGVPAGGYR